MSFSSPKLLVTVQGSPLTELPNDLYIPVDYFEILLEQFEGPLDLLLYLIKKKNFDILNLPVGPITEQYLHYLEKFKRTRRELALEYLVMAAALIELKSRLLLPPVKKEGSDEEEIDPRAALIARLQAYEQCQKLSHHIDELPRVERDFFVFHRSFEQHPITYLCSQQQLYQALQNVLLKQARLEPHTLKRESFTVEQACEIVIAHLENGGISWHDWLRALPSHMRNKHYQITFFLAILELSKQYMAVLFQESCFGPILIMKSQETPYEHKLFS